MDPMREWPGFGIDPTYDFRMMMEQDKLDRARQEYLDRGTIQPPGPFSLRNAMRNGLIRTEGLDSANRIFGRTPDEGGLGDWFGLGIADGIDGAFDAFDNGLSWGNSVDMGLGALEALGAGALAKRGLRGLSAMPQRAIDMEGYTIGRGVSRPGSGYQPVPGKPAQARIPTNADGPGYNNWTPFETKPIFELERAAEDYVRRNGIAGSGRTAQFDPLDENRARMIAEEFERMKHDPMNPDVRRSYDAMIEETMQQYRAIEDLGLDIRFNKDGLDPYANSPSMGYADLVGRGRLNVFPTDDGFGTLNSVDDNPLLKRVGRIGDLENATANDAFRVVHDIFGHFAPGNPYFRAPGEERAWQKHAAMYSPEARGAMTTETRGQNSWLNFGPYAEQNRTAKGADTIFADQKVGLMSPWTWELP